MPFKTLTSSLYTSVVRTFVPILVAVLVNIGLRVGLEIEEEAIAGAVTAVVTTLYYVAVRWLETNLSPAWGWLVGKASAPQYLNNQPVETVE